MTDGRGPHTLTKDEFQLLLQKAAERDVFREPRLFSLPELVEAGRELGLAPASVQEVYAEYQRGQTPLVHRRPPPIGLRFRLIVAGDTLRLFQPPPQNSLSLPSRMIMAAVPGVLAFIGLSASWEALPVAATLGAAAYLGFTLWGLGPAYDLRLARNGSGLLMRRVGRRIDTFPLVAGQVHVRPATRIETSNGAASTVAFLALDHGIQTFALLENYSHAELVYAAQEIEGWLGR